MNAPNKSGWKPQMEVADASGERAAAALGRSRRARIVLWQALGGTPAQPSSEDTVRSTSQ